VQENCGTGTGEQAEAVLNPSPVPPVPVLADPPMPVPDKTVAQEVAEDDHNIVVSAHRHVPYDPLERVNKVSFDGVQAVDRAVVGPMAMGYERIVPEPLRDGVHNMVHNLREPYIAVNFLLQHRIGKSAETIARFIINSTVGVGGLFDMARRKPIHLPRRPNGFADTLGFYGVKPGPYLFLPLVGPTTVRDLFGNIVDRSLLPLATGRLLHKPIYVLPSLVFGAMDRRLQNKERIDRTREATSPYQAMREDYLLRRRLEIEGCIIIARTSPRSSRKKSRSRRPNPLPPAIAPGSPAIARHVRASHRDSAV
jgi:phospholipid-binding lipoprotein MlaA